MTRCYECENYNHVDCRKGMIGRDGREQKCNCATCILRFKSRRIRIG